MVRRFDFVLSVLAFLLVLVMASCNVAPSATPPATQPAAPAVTRLRIHNTSAQDFTNLVLLFPDQRVEFGNLPAGATSAYLEVPGGVYNFAAYEYELNGETVTQPVRDWVGEEPLEAGSYTYVINFEKSGTENEMITLQEVQRD